MFDDKAGFEVKIDAFEVLAVHRQAYFKRFGQQIEQGAESGGAQAAAAQPVVEVKFMDKILPLPLFPLLCAQETFDNSINSTS